METVKKEYKNPEMEVVELEQTAPLLDGSKTTFEDWEDDENI